MKTLNRLVLRTSRKIINEEISGRGTILTKSIIIIGAGVSGLWAGCYAAMNSFTVRIVEAHTVPGELCTSLKRKGYLIDDSCHMLMGTDPANSYCQIWNELGAIQDRDLYYYESFAGMSAGFCCAGIL